MPILDDEQFEEYLKEFRPVAAKSLQFQRQPSRARPRRFAYLAWTAACAASLLMAFLLWHRLKPAPPAIALQLARSQSLTLGRANALLARAPSLKEAFDEPSFQPQPASQPEGKQSALAVLTECACLAQ